MPSYAPINALTRGLEVLRTLNEMGQASVGDLHRLTEIPKPTLVRILETYVVAGYVAQSDEEEVYAPTARVLQLSSGFSEAREITRVAVPLIDQFRARVVWPSDVAIFDANEMVIINTSRTPGTLSVNRTVGSRVPLLLTALGRAYCAFLSDSEQEYIVESVAASNLVDQKIACQPRVLKGIFEKTRERGYAVSDRENIETIRAIGVPILRHGEAVGAFNIMVVSDAMSLAKLERGYANEMVKLGEEIARAMAGG